MCGWPCFNLSGNPCWLSLTNENECIHGRTQSEVSSQVAVMCFSSTSNAQQHTQTLMQVLAHIHTYRHTNRHTHVHTLKTHTRARTGASSAPIHQPNKSVDLLGDLFSEPVPPSTNPLFDPSQQQTAYSAPVANPYQQQQPQAFPPQPMQQQQQQQQQLNPYMQSQVRVLCVYVWVRCL